MSAYLKAQVALGRGSDVSLLKDVCGTMWVHRSRFQFRKTFVATSVDELATKVTAFAKGCNVQPCGEGRKMQVRKCSGHVGHWTLDTSRPRCPAVFSLLPMLILSSTRLPPVPSTKPPSPSFHCAR
jgi:hypothetical protein